MAVWELSGGCQPQPHASPHVASSCALGFSHHGSWISRGRKKKWYFSLGLGSEVREHHFLCILVVRANRKNSSDSRREEIVPSCSCDKRCACAGWGRVLCTTLGASLPPKKREVHIHHHSDPPKTGQMVSLSAQGLTTIQKGV